MHVLNLLWLIARHTLAWQQLSTRLAAVVICSLETRQAMVNVSLANLATRLLVAESCAQLNQGRWVDMKKIVSMYQDQLHTKITHHRLKQCSYTIEEYFIKNVNNPVFCRLQHAAYANCN